MDDFDSSTPPDRTNPLSGSFGQRQIGMIPGDGPVFRSEVDFSSFAAKFSPQQMSEWCWAASISNVFAYYKHPVSQDRIVRDVYKDITNMPALSARMIAQEINKRWTDDDGVRFSAHLTAAYDFQASVYAINNTFMIGELNAGRPIIVCNSHHCMVVTAIEYTQFRVMTVGVFDPWPGIGPRSLTAAEMVPKNYGGDLMFLGSLTVGSD